MKSSPVYPKYENLDYNEYEFDPQVDFAQFVKEARTQACNLNFEEAPPYAHEAGKKQMDEGQKHKKSWRRSLFSWLKAADKKSRPTVERSNSSYNLPNPKRGYVSGPIHANGGGVIGGPKRPTSGPLTGLFNSTMKMDDKNNIPYLCLNRLNNPHSVQSYGPIYMVT
ncbi:hypothetical protein LguiA_010102 [Lonicera macranthoides]